MYICLHKRCPKKGQKRNMVEFDKSIVVMNQAKNANFGKKTF